MTRTPVILGPEYDAPAKLPDSLHRYQPKRQRALAELDRAEAAEEAEIAQLMFWELGIIDLILAPTEDNASPYGLGDYEPYAAHFHLTPEATTYALERASETQDVILKLHYLEYAILQMPAKGREWIEKQRELLTTYREYVEGCRSAGHSDEAEFTGLHIERALIAIGRLLRRPGLLQGSEATEWGTWLITLAQDSRLFPTRDPALVEQQRHRWVADYLIHLADLPANAVGQVERLRALAMLDEASAFYQSTPLNDHFEQRVAEVDATLRKHWGEAGTHERLIRRQFDSIIRRAEFHKSTGNGFLTAHFYREARELVESQRQYFTADDVTRLQLEERAALEHAVAAGEFAEIRIPIEIPYEMMDYTRDTADATMEALLKEILNSVPNRAQIAQEVGQTATDAPLQAIIPRTVIGPGKVVAESPTPETNHALDVERQATLYTHLLGGAVATTLSHAVDAVGLTTDHLMAPLASLQLDAGTTTLVRQGCERFLQKDFISTLHILVPQFEDVLRQHLKSRGVDTTEFRRDVGDGTSRTDDAALGTLMRRALPDGRSVRDYLGNDLWDHLDSTLNSQTGLNLRNVFAHGFARPSHCSPENAGLVLSLFYLLAEVAKNNTNKSTTNDA